MPLLRTVELVVTDELKELFASKVRQETFADAIGYLSLWGVGGNATKVRIHFSKNRVTKDEDIDYMEATYTYSDGIREHQVFVIGALFRDGKWESNS